MNDVIKALKKSKRVAIISHVSPDPDCMGSMTALSCILKSMGKEVKMFNDTKTLSPELLYFNLPEDLSVDLNPEDFDTLVSVDLPSKRQLGKYSEVFCKFDNTVSIDHHSSRDLIAKYMYVDNTSSSCAEIILQLALKMNVSITKEIANYLFAGLIGDTNCFENDNVNINTHKHAMALYELGADTKEIIFIIHKHIPEKYLKLKRMVYENITTVSDIAYFIFTRKMQKEIGTDDIGNMTNEILNIGDNKISFIIKQKEKNVYTVGFRCKYGYDVSKVAMKYGGGGHTQASGMMFVGSPQKHLKSILNDCLNEIKEKDNV